jgi:uncharacterized metal-binding protein YceD (DUF177 family)
MPDISPNIGTRARDNPEFARIIAVSHLRGLGEAAFDLSPTPEEAVAIARLMDIRGLRKMRFHGRLVPGRDGAWVLEATLGATVTQSCVVSLEPVVTRIETPVKRHFVPGLAEDGPDVPVTALDDDEDEVDPLGDRIDLGRVALEALALALPAYPRKPGAVLEAREAAPQGAAEPAEAEIRPFAVLAALRGKVDDAS